MISLNKLTLLVGLILSIFVAAPLYTFLSGLEDGFNVEVESIDEELRITLYYNIEIPLTEVKLVVKAGDRIYEASAKKLYEGDTLSLQIPFKAAESLEYIRFEGSIAGLYKVSLTLRGVTGG
ncbi:MAG: hypothetical protein F7B17_05655 [Desulfurococcales archaeon]|nr:hypothetical protein [Desulfurococcales archaeon]